MEPVLVPDSKNRAGTAGQSGCRCQPESPKKKIAGGRSRNGLSSAGDGGRFGTRESAGPLDPGLVTGLASHRNNRPTQTHRREGLCASCQYCGWTRINLVSTQTPGEG